MGRAKRAITLVSAAWFACAPRTTVDGADLSESLKSVGLSAYWSARLPVGAADSVKEAFLVDEALYVGTNQGLLFSLERETGLIRWGLKATEPGYRIYRPTHVPSQDGTGETILVTTDGFRLLDRHSGEDRDRFVPLFAPGGGAVGSNNHLFAGGADGRFYSLFLPVAGTHDWRVYWRVQVDGPVTVTPNLDGSGNLVFATQGGTVYSCRAADKALNWSFCTGGPILGDPAVVVGAVFVASMDRSVYRLRAGRGNQQWRTRLPGPLREGPLMAGQTVFQPCEGFGVFALDATTGAQRWNVVQAGSFVAHQRDRDLLFSTDNRLLVIDHKNGGLESEFEVAPFDRAVSNPVDDAVYLLSDRGEVLALRLESVPYLRYQQILAAKERLNTRPRASSTAAAPDAPALQTEEDPFRSSRDPRR